MSVVSEHDSSLELFICDPKADVPANESSEWSVEAFVESLEALVASGLDGARQGTAVSSFCAVHES